MSAQSLPSIPGYTLSEQIYAGSRTCVYRAVSEQAGESVVIKVLRAHAPSESELARFRNQYIIAKKLDISGILKPLALLPWNHRYALVMEDVGSVSLRDYLQTHGRFSIEQVMAIALQLADSLHHLSQKRILHKDINPTNILIHPNTHQVYLTDFGLASLLPKESQDRQSPDDLEGTLAYIAPEQTGRMNRGIDYRVDFYSLGVTLYELFTGERPFQSDDPMELIHCHIAKAPVPPYDLLSRSVELSSRGVATEVSHAPIIPLPLSDIVLKLMAKNAEDRYQSALGLKHDLQKCLDQWTETGTVGEFELGQRDVCDRFLIPEKLYGRETEVQTLLDTFQRVAQGHSELMLVAGFAGVGKTAVVNEVYKPITQKKGYFLKGKFDQLNYNIPFSAFVQAFRGLMNQLLSESDAELAQWKANILEAISDNGQVLLDVIPELEKIIGPQPTVPELLGNAAQNRFNLLFSKFLRLFATATHPLVIFLDDLQWVDSASLNLLKSLMDDSETKHLLMIGAYRDHEMSPAHPLMIALGEMDSLAATINKLSLAPLTTTDIDHLIADTFICPLERSLPFSRLVYQHTQGNPFFTKQFLQGLYQDGCIIFESNLGYWLCDLAQIRQLPLTDDVVAFMVERLKKLPPDTQSVLKFAACLGNQFDLATLTLVCERSQESIAADLWQGLQSGFVIPDSKIYKFFQGHDDGQESPGNESDDTREFQSINDITVGYRFLHDRVQQAVYSLISEEQKKNTHMNIGSSLLEKTPDEQLEEKVFDIVSHLNRGIELIVSKEKQIQLSLLNLLAAQSAKSCTAYITAWQYLETGIQLLEVDCWENHHNLTLRLYVEAVEISYLKGDFETMKTMAEKVLSRTHNMLDRVKIYETQLQSLSSQSQYSEAIEVGLTCLKNLGINVPFDPTDEDVVTWLEKTKITLEGFSDQSLIELPDITNREIEAAIRMLVRLGPPSYFVNPNLLAIIICKAFSLSLEYGKNLDTPLIFTNYAMVLCGPSIGDLSEGYRVGKIGEKILKKQNKNSRRALVLNNFYLFVSHWSKHYSHSIIPFKEGCQHALEVGDLEFAGYNRNNQTICEYCLGKELSGLIIECRQCLEFCHSIHAEGTVLATTFIFQTIHNLIHGSETPWSLQGVFCDESGTVEIFKESQHSVGISMHGFSKLYLNYLFDGDLEVAPLISDLEEHLDAMGGSLLLPLFTFIGGLIYLSIAEEMIGEQKVKCLERAEKWGARLEFWAHHAPMNYQHKADLIQAEKKRVLGQKLEAIELYDKSISGAKENGYIQEEAIANELAAKFYLEWGKQRFAALYMQAAYYCYARWGATAKTAQLKQRYPQLLETVLLKKERAVNPFTTLSNVAPLNISVHSSSSNSQSSHSGINEKLDLTTILQASQALTESIDLNDLLQKIARLMLQVSGADQLTLLLPKADGSWQVRVSATPDDTLLTEVPLVNHENLPVQLIQYVQRTQEILAVDDFERDLPFVDSFLQQYQPRSVLCLPIVFQEKLNGLLYLQNQSVESVFTGDHVTVINFLCAQAAISLENSHLYQLEQRKTKQLAASEGRLKTLFDQSTDAVFLLGEQGFIDCNQAALDLFQAPSKYDFLGLQLHQISPERQPDGQLSKVKAQCMLKEALQRSSSFQFEWVYQRRNGEEFWAEVTLTSIKYQTEAICHCITRDISDRKRTEAALKLSEARANAAFDQAAAGIFEFNRETGQFTRCNHFFCQMLGYTESELLQLAVSDVTHPDYLTDFSQKLQQLQAGEVDYFTFEKRLVHKDRSTGWVSSTVSQIQLPGEAVRRNLVVVLDISDRKATELALKEAQDRLRRITENIPGVIFRCVMDPDGVDMVTDISSQVREIYELEPEAVLADGGRQMMARSHPDDLERMAADIQTSAETLQPFKYEQRLILPEKGLRWVQSIAQPEHLNNGYMAWDGVIIDITDRKEAELALEQEVLRRTSIFNTSSDGIHILDMQGNLIEANSTFCLSLGYTPEEAKHLNVADWDEKILPEEIQANFQEHYLKLVQLRIVETLYRRKDSSIFPVEISICAMELNDQISFICISRDISERKQAEAKLQRTNEELIRATRLKDEFLANMSHELRTPLNAILGLSEGLQDGVFGSLTKQQLKYLKTIERSGTHLLNLINDILDVAKIEAGQLELNSEATHIDSLCESSLAFIKQQAFKKRISLTHKMPFQALILKIDERRILQSLVNLLNNAVKFTPEGGCVALEVSCHLQTEHQKPFEARSPSQDTQNPNKCVWESGPLMAKNYIKLSVRDTGIGIAQKHINTLFKPFSQVDSSLNRKYMGTGLGLVLVKQIVELHGGTVHLTSEVGVGSCFSIKLPYEFESSLVKPEPSSADISPFSVPKSAQPDDAPLILLAEDNEDTINLMVPYLEATGYRLMVAKNGLEALEITKTHSPDLILMDIQMPELDGLESIQRIRQLSQFNQVPIIALTALAMKGDQERCLAAGANQYLSKPIKLKQLLQSIQKLLVQ